MKKIKKEIKKPNTISVLESKFGLTQLPVICYLCNKRITELWLMNRKIAEEANIRTVCTDCYDSLIDPIMKFYETTIDNISKRKRNEKKLAQIQVR